MALCNYSPTLKMWGYTGFALSFRHSVTDILSFRNLSDENFCHTFLRNCEAYNIETWYTWTVDRYIVYTGIRLLLLIRPFISSFFFLSNRRLKLSTHVDSGQMYHVYQNQAAPAYSSLYFFIFLSLQFSNIEIFRHTFLRNCEA